MQSIKTGDPDSLHPEDMSYSKRLKETLKNLSIGEPTYWPSDENKPQDLVDFCITKDIPKDFTVARSCFDLSYDHSPVLITLTAHVLNQEKQPCLSSRHANWDVRCLINEINFKHFP
jgi:hypothetical protein